eukprot:CAMPEP_0118854934 /NCGR_PEP_ID=MMETSP1163-20130328/2941_1 /TAXON_ID=124430 /ORGANISM="Phaeomonas parva, Strain CCMP2877" /LENGTH=95 /DNA_ID=CAMNT_0006787733 /DNA_START=210 /DNA_END=494 /DNA_ORIENTATION=-
MRTREIVGLCLRRPCGTYVMFPFPSDDSSDMVAGTFALSPPAALSSARSDTRPADFGRVFMPRRLDDVVVLRAKEGNPSLRLTDSGSSNRRWSPL